MDTNSRSVQNGAPRHRAHSDPRKGGKRLFALGAIALFAAALLPSPDPATPAHAACELAFDPPSVMVGSEEVEVTATPSQETDRPNHVVVDDASGLHITLSEEDPFQLTVDAMAAEAGEWMVTLVRDEVELCRGPLDVIVPNR